MQELREMQVWSLGLEDTLEEGMTTRLENSMDRGAWQDYTVYRVAQSWTRLKQLSMHTRTQAFRGPIVSHKPQVRLGSLGIN